MKVLIIDDRLETVKDIITHCKDKEWEYSAISFDEFDESLISFDPDAIVLDWKDDTSSEHIGESIIRKIWENGFKPIIIFSGVADTFTLDEKYLKSNLVRIQRKGDETPVIEYLDMIQPFVPTIKTIKEDFNNALIEASNALFMINQSQQGNTNVTRYILSKRVSSFFDSECAEEHPPPWVQYTYPPIAQSLRVCDIIRKIPSNRLVNEANIIGQPNEYKIILTPSCDIAQSKIDNILCAKCYPKETFHTFNLSSKPSQKQLNRIKSDLNRGYNSAHCVPIPGIPEVLPYLTIDLRDVEQIPLEEITLRKDDIDDNHVYYRVTSMDSPFREQIVWAYMISSCRPGMPNRNVSVWAEELMKP
jgi:CTP synthase